MHRPKVGERIILELLASGESYPSEVQAVDDSVMRVTPAMRGPDLPEPGGAVRITFVRKDGKHAIIKLKPGFSAEEIGMRIGVF